MTALAGYYADLGKAYPELANNASYQSIMPHLAKLNAARTSRCLATPPADLAAALAAVKTEVDGLAADTVALQQTSRPPTPRRSSGHKTFPTLAATQQGEPTPDPG